MTQTTDLTGAQDLQQRFVEALNHKDLDTFMGCLWDSPELIVVLWGNVIRGAEDMRASISQFFDANETIRATVSESTSVPVGDGVMTVGTATYDLVSKAGEASQIVEVWTDLARPVDGRWVYVLDQATVVPQ